jgi:hypothetical protein
MGAPMVTSVAAHTRNVAITRASELRIGELRRQVVFGSEAVYRVCGWERDLVEVEVVRAPGLTAGQRFQFALTAVTQMVLVADPADQRSTPDGS